MDTPVPGASATLPLSSEKPDIPAPVLKKTLHFKLPAFVSGAGLRYEPRRRAPRRPPMDIQGEPLMRILVLPVVAVGILGLGLTAALAQEVLPRPERIPEKVPPPPPKTEVPIEGSPVPCHPVTRPLVYERLEPVQILADREIIQVDKVPTLKVAFRKEKRKVTDLILKERPVNRVVCYTTLEPCPVTDPCTGQTSTVLKPVERTRIQKDLEFVTVPVERVEVVDVPFLTEDFELVPRKTVVFDYITVMQRRDYAVGIPAEAAPPIRYVAPPLPPPGCSADGHP
jgi:hypothetical protein